jgi:hypothetical protein
MTERELIADLLEPVGEPVAMCADMRFIARDRFLLDRGGELPISYIGDDFTAHFLDLIEEGVEAAALQQYRLTKGAVDALIFAALGGQDRARIALAHLHHFLKTADRAHWFFFYVTDASGMLWAVDAYWRDHGWDLEAYSVTYPRGWRSGGRVVSS